MVREAEEPKGKHFGGILTVGRGAELAVRLNIRHVFKIFLSHHGSQCKTTQIIFIPAQGASPSSFPFIC